MQETWVRSIPVLWGSPGEGKGYPLQYSGLENSMDCTVHGVTKSCTWVRDFHFTSGWCRPGYSEIRSVPKRKHRNLRRRKKEQFLKHFWHSSTKKKQQFCGLYFSFKKKKLSEEIIFIPFFSSPQKKKWLKKVQKMLLYFYLVGIGTSANPCSSTAGDSLTNATTVRSKNSNSPTKMLEASAPGGIFFIKCRSTWEHHKVKYIKIGQTC